MEKVILDGRRMKTKKITHLYLKEKLSLPEYYGENLDALWDILSSYNESLTIKLYNEEELIENLGEYGLSIIKLLKDICIDNKNIYFVK